jgi:hypothetical protein
VAQWGAKGDHNRHSASDLITEFQSGQRPSQRQKTAFSKIFIRSRDKCSASACRHREATVLAVLPLYLSS